MDQRVWIVGASTGIGAALARAFAADGARLVLSARGARTLEEVAGGCYGAAGVEVLPLDLAEPERFPDLVDHVISVHGRIDVLVLNAGIVARDLALRTSLAIDRRIMEVNYFGPIAMAKAVLPHMVARGSGRIAVVTSLSGRYGVPKLSAYAASKHALHGFFETLRTEVYREGIRITMVIPGFIRTDIVRKGVDGAGMPRGRDLAVNERGMSPEQCARGILRAIHSGREEALVGGMEMKSLLLQRFFPDLHRYLMRNNPIKRLRAVFGKGG